jgi:hypothetical protein
MTTTVPATCQHPTAEPVRTKTGVLRAATKNRRTATTGPLHTDTNPTPGVSIG